MNKVWITRTEPGASKLARQLADRGYTPLAWPVLEIEYFGKPSATSVDEKLDVATSRPIAAQLDGHPLDVQSALADSPQVVIALSGHAVRVFLNLELQRRAREARYIAVGEATANELSGAGIAVQVPQQTTSEGILAFAERAGLKAGDRVWLLAGEGGRDLLARQLLSQFRVSVVKLELYRRVNRTQAPPADAQQIGAVVIASQQGLQAFAPLWRDMGGAMNVPVIVPSRRVADTVTQAGFEHVHCARGAEAEAVMAELQTIAGAGLK